MNNRRFKGVLKFSLIAFAPISFFLFIFYLPGIFINLAISLPGEGNDIKLFFLLLGIGLIAYYFLISFVCFDRFVSTDDFKRKLFIMYIGWLFLAYPMVFLFLNAMGGVSMAVVESKAGYITRLPQYLLFTSKVMLWGHILFIPWILLANIIINKTIKNPRI